MTVTDDDGHEETQVITLTVSPVNDAGSFSGDTSGTGSEDDSSSPERSPLLMRLMAAPLSTYTVSSDAIQRYASIDAAGAWTYAPNQHFNGDSFTVKVTDDDGKTQRHHPDCLPSK